MFDVFYVIVRTFPILLDALNKFLVIFIVCCTLDCSEKFFDRMMNLSSLTFVHSSYIYLNKNKRFASLISNFNHKIVFTLCIPIQNQRNYAQHFQLLLFHRISVVLSVQCMILDSLLCRQSLKLKID